jgi:hypothetical protein
MLDVLCWAGGFMRLASAYWKNFMNTGAGNESWRSSGRHALARSDFNFQEPVAKLLRNRKERKERKEKQNSLFLCVLCVLCG